MRQASRLATQLVGTLTCLVISAQAAQPPAKNAFAGVAWTGASNTDWHAAANWSGGAVPGATDDVLIDAIAGTNQPTLNLAGGAVTIKSLTIGSTTNATLTFKNSLATDDNRRLQVTGNVTIGAKGKLTHTLETAAGVGPETQQLRLDVGGDLTITANGKIDVTGCGYSTGPGVGIGDNRGGSHGGEGGWDSATPGAAGVTYGTATNPVTSGSANGDGSGGTRGGGTVKLAIGGTLNLNGWIDASGVGGWGGSAGGSVNITAGKLTGSGTVYAIGGDDTPAGQNGGGGGGGGRIAIVLNGSGDDAKYAKFAGLTILACGGAQKPGAAGTVYLKGNDTPNGRLLVDNSNRVTSAGTLIKNQTLLVDRIEARNGGRLAFGAGCALDLSQGCVLTSDSTSRFIVDSSGNPTIRWPASFTIGGATTPLTLSWKGTSEYTINCANLTIATNGVLTHEPANGIITPAPAWGVATWIGEDNMLYAKIQGNLTIQAGGKIDVSACGCDIKQGACPATQGAAASHAGQGGGGASELPYGSVTDPARSGSGGSHTRGGGVAKLTVMGDLNVNGPVCADAGGPGWFGAAGGSVNITAGKLTHSGSATISANGGEGGSGQTHGGGGGRVAIALTNAADTAFAGMTITAYGGTKGGGEAGAAGTVYLKGKNATYGNLIVDNKPNPVTTRRTLINANTGDLTVNNVVLRNNGRISFDAVARKLTVYGSWFNGNEPEAFCASDLAPNAATVVIAGGAPATVTGTNIWYNLTITNANKVVTFQDGATQTVDSAGTLTLGSNVKLRTASGAPFAFAKGPPRGVDGVLRDKTPLYTVRVQGKEVEVYACPNGAQANFVTCDMAGPVTVEVTVNFLDAAKINGISVHPLSRGIKAQREGARVTFQVDRPGSLTLLVNGDHFLQPLHLFLCPPVKPPPPGAIVFGPGRHVVGPDKPIELKSGQTLYLAPGSWVEGFVRANNASNISIMGRGVLSQRIPLPKKNYQGADDCPSGIVFGNCTNVLIEGIVQTRAHINWNIIPIHCDGVTLRDVHVLAPVSCSTDGCNPVNTRNVTIERCFFRVNDDNISPKGDYGVSPENMQLALENITIRDTVFWSHQARLFSIGPESVTKRIRNIKMQNCDVLYHSGGGTFAILPVYGVEVRDVLFEDIRVETIARPEFALFCIGLASGQNAICGATSAESPSIRGVTIRNVTVLQPTPVRCNSIEGWSADKLVQDVLIENLRYGDEVIRDAKAMGLKTNAWVKNLRFIGPEGK